MAADSPDPKNKKKEIQHKEQHSQKETLEDSFQSQFLIRKEEGVESKRKEQKLRG
jgi:hypothetical protein